MRRWSSTWPVTPVVEVRGARLPPIGPDAGTSLTEALASDMSPTMAAAASVATSTRQLIQVLMETDAPTVDLLQAAALVEQAAELLNVAPRRRARDGDAASSLADDERTFLRFSPMVGAANPLAVPLEVGVEGDHVVADAAFGDAYEGPPGCVHGGFVAAAFDELLGFTMSFTGLIGMTTRLEVRYRKPTPLHRRLRFDGHVERVDGRKIFTKGTLHDGDTLTAEANALYVAIDAGVFMNLGSGAPPAT